MSSTLSTPPPVPVAGANAPTAACHLAKDRSSAFPPGPDGCQWFPELRNACDHESCESRAADDHGTDQHPDERPCGPRAEQVIGHVQDKPADSSRDGGGEEHPGERSEGL